MFGWRGVLGVFGWFGREISRIEHESIRYYETIIDLDPDNARAYYKLSNTCIRLGNYEKALHCIEKAIVLACRLPDSFYAYAYNSRGVIRGQQCAYTAALKDFETALELSPDNGIITTNINRVKLVMEGNIANHSFCLLYTSPSPRD